LIAAIFAVMGASQCMSTAPEGITEMTKAQMPMESAAEAPASADIGPLLNDLRAQNGRDGVKADPRLMQAAAAHSADMARRGTLGHTGANGSSVKDRIEAQGYSACFVAENVAQGQRTTGEVFNAWKDSGSHRRNMLNADAQAYGFARGSGNYWTLVLAEPGC